MKCVIYSTLTVQPNSMHSKSNDMKSGNAKKLLTLASVYFAICGITAIFFPQSWYWAAGVGGEEWNLPLAIVGGMMMGLSVAGFGAVQHLDKAAPVVYGLIAANVCDAAIVISYTSTHALPLINGLILALVDLIWAICLARVLRREE